MNSEKSNNVSEVYDEVSLKELILRLKGWFLYLRSKWLIILAFGVIGGCLGLFYSQIKKPVYTATTTFVLEEGGGGLGKYAGLASLAGLDMGGGGNAGLFSEDNIVELYKSKKMLKEALLSRVMIKDKPQLLIDRFIQINKLGEKFATSPKLKNIRFDDQKKFTIVHDSLLNAFTSDLRDNYIMVSKLDKQLSIIKVEVKSSDEIFSKLFADQIVGNVNKFYIDTKTKRSLQNVVILQGQKDSVQSVMNGAIFSSAATIDATPNLNPTKQLLRAPVQRSQFNAETNKAILSELVKNLELAKISLRNETPLIQVIDEPILPLEKKLLSKLKGIVYGAVFSMVLGCMILSGRRFFKKIID